jgi:hypothetical protein
MIKITVMSPPDIKRNLSVYAEENNIRTELNGKNGMWIYLPHMVSQPNSSSPINKHVACEIIFIYYRFLIKNNQISRRAQHV